jgi:enamine deaminase RidA (YjgF/YER057c/UK114 family)
MSVVEKNLQALGLEVPGVPKGVGNYVGAVRSGNLVFVSGHGPARDGEFVYVGKVGADVDTETARRAAELVVLNCLASLKEEIGDLDRVVRVIKLLGMVNSAPSYCEQPKVIDAASELLVHIFGQRGRHARSAVGMASLPFDISVEIEMVVEVGDGR